MKKWLRARIAAVAVSGLAVACVSDHGIQVDRTGEVARDTYCDEVQRDAETHPTSARIFADRASAMQKPDWHEFRSEAERDAAGTGDNLYQSAFVWERSGAVVLARVTSFNPSGDFTAVSA